MKIICSNCNDMNREEVEMEVFDLLESKDFQELSNEEQEKVALIMTPGEYQLQRRILSETSSMDSPVAGPLVIPQKRNVIPIWIASLGSAAAAAVLVFLMMDTPKVNDIKLQSVSPLVVRDTLIVENTITDTIIDFRVVQANDSKGTEAAIHLVQVPEVVSGAVSVPAFREEELVNTGVSAANDAVIETFRTQPFIGM